MTKIVINRCYGGFSLSDAAVVRLQELGYALDPSYLSLNIDSQNWHNLNIERDDPRLVQTVEELGAEASGRVAELKVIEVPDGVEWQIEEYDGLEWVAEKHQKWG